MVLEYVALLSLIIFFGFVAERLFQRFSVPDLFLLVMLGLLLGPLGFRNVIPGLETLTPESLLPYAPLLAVLTLIVILFDAGLGLDAKELVGQTGFALAGTGITLLLSTVLTTLILILLGYAFLPAFLLALVLSDVAEGILFPLIRPLKLRPWVRVYIGAESILTSVFIAVILAFVISVLSPGAQFNIGAGLRELAQGLATSISVAFVVGIIASFAWLKVLESGLIPAHRYALTLAFAMLLYSGLELAFSGNGIITVLIFGLVVATARKRLDAQIFDFHQEISFLVRTFFFTYLGFVLVLQNLTLSLFIASIGVMFGLAMGRFLGVLVVAWKHRPTFPEFLLLASALSSGIETATFATLIAASGIAVPNMLELVVLVIFETIIFSAVGVFLYSLLLRFFPLPAEAKRQA